MTHLPLQKDGTPYKANICRKTVQIGKNLSKYQPSGEGGTRSPPATLHRLQNPKWPQGCPKMVGGVYPWVLGHSKQLLLNKFFDPSTPFMRKVDDGEEKKKEKKRK